MKTAQLQPNKNFIYRSTCRDYKVQFIERIPKCGRVRPAVNVFKSSELGVITMPDKDVWKNIFPVTAGKPA